MIQLFQDALPVCLLYPQERPQYEALLLQQQQQQQNSKKQKNQKYNGVCLADVYGCEFLLRLYVRLPVLMQAEMTAKMNQQTNAGTSTNMNTNNNDNNDNNNTNMDNTVALQLSRDIQYIGPLLTELLVLLQKNRQACFKGNYRQTKPEEWLDWEQRLYGSGGVSGVGGHRISSGSSTAIRGGGGGAVAATATPTEGVEMDTR
jgi:hypothetical protein